jgi:hypothetical protein
MRMNSLSRHGGMKKDGEKYITGIFAREWCRLDKK